MEVGVQKNRKHGGDGLWLLSNCFECDVEEYV